MGPTPGSASLPILHEVRHALAALLTSGTETTIDLRGLPLTRADEQAIEDFLEAGEVRATIDAVGRSEIRETGVPGVWLVEHFDAADQSRVKLVEITFIPSLLKSQHPDAEHGLRRLDEGLGSLPAEDLA